jgi:hypothetical protein
VAVNRQGAALTGVACRSVRGGHAVSAQTGRISGQHAQAMALLVTD